MNAILNDVDSDLGPIKAQLEALSQKYRDGGQDRIGWEVLQAVRALNEAMHIAEAYRWKPCGDVLKAP